jgi:hypothetical protein
LRAAVYNLSHPHYNLGAAKLSAWLRSEGWDVEDLAEDPLLMVARYDLLCLSAIFSWDVPKGVGPARLAPGEVWAGGPGFMQMAGWWRRETGNDAVLGLDERFERQRGDFRMCFAARGCPWDCHFCGVTKWEGAEYSLDWDFRPAPILCDNNLTDEPVDFQEHVIRRYNNFVIPLLDANSGFEPRNFTEETYRRWKAILRGPWRCGYDYLPERGAVRRMLSILKDEPAKKKRVYVLIGNEPFDVCLQRAREVIEWGGEPYCQPFLSKSALHRHDYELRYDWTPDKLTHFARYFNRFTWRYASLPEYECRGRRPFLEIVA